MDLTIGMKGTASTLVERSDTALKWVPATFLVYATPCMAALMEGAACEAIVPALEEGQTSVGIALDLAHTSATPVGLEVRAEAGGHRHLREKIITFQVTAFDEAGEIGRATHQRALVTAQRFLEKTYEKL